MYTLYSIGGTCSTGITVLMEKLGLDFQVIQRSDIDNYEDIVPTNQVPALKLDNGDVITEGAAIALYLTEKHAPDTLPTDAEGRANFYRWLMFNYATLHPAYSKMFTIAFKVDLDEAEKENLQRQLAEQVSSLWQIVDKHLENTAFTAGDSPSIIDYLLAVYSSWNNYFPDTKITLGKNVEQLVDVITKLPEFEAAYAREDTEYKKAA